MPDYLDVVLCKNDGSNFLEMDIVRRAINIPTDYQLEGLVSKSLLPTAMVLTIRRHTNIIPNKDNVETMKKLTYDTFKRMRKDEKEDVFRQAHDCSIRNKRQLEQSKLCGCFSCCEIFPPSEITDYISDEEPTAECPYCHIDAVIGDASGFPITEEFLREMMHRWFG